MKDFIIEKMDLMIPNPICELIYVDDFTLLISIILSSQSQDKEVNKISPFLFEKFKSFTDIDEKSYDQIEKIIRPLGLSKIKAKNIIRLSNLIKEKYSGSIPSNYDDLLNLPGVGNKTAKVFLIEYYKKNFFPVDTHVKRVAQRLGIASMEDNVNDIERRLNRLFINRNMSRLHQQFVLHGRYVCKAKNPECEKCLLKEKCKYFNNKNHL